MLKINHKLFMFYLALIFLLSTALAVFPDLKSNSQEDPNPISELYQEVTPDYMKDVVNNIKSLLNSFVFLDILNNPPSPYDNSIVDLLEVFDNINTDENRPFYEFYRDIKNALSRSRDASLDILGGKVPLGNEEINFEE